MNRRIKSLLWIFSGLLCLVTVRTFYLQVWNGPDTGASLAAKALNFRSQVISGEEYYRGEILDRNLLSLTDSGIRPALVAFPTLMTSVSEAAAQLEKVLGVEANTMITVIRKGQDTFGSRTPVVLKKNLTEAEVKKLDAAVIPGITVVPMKNRYGSGAVAKHIVGYVNSINEKQWEDLTNNKKTVQTNPELPTAYRITDSIGVAGLEGKYEAALKGSRPENRIRAVADANGQIIQGLGFLKQEEPADPWRNHLVLTLDKRYQEIVEQTMDKSIVRGAVVVLDVATGDVLAAASRPDFDQNQVSKYLSGVDEFIDRTQRVAFYPGSVFKMVVAAGVLEEGLIEPDELFNCTGAYVFSDNTQIKCLHEHGKISFSEAISKSCNTTFVQLGLRLGNSKLKEYAAKLGFDISISNASVPALVGNASIGQEGVLVSPLQIANLYATIARNGAYQPCRIVSEIRNYQGDVIQEFPARPALQVISANTCKILTQTLITAVQSGSGASAWLENSGTAGKTGTAEVNDQNKVIAWFAGFTPAANPRLAIAVMVEESSQGGRSGLSGGSAAAPVFKEIATEILKLESGNN